MLRVIIIPLSTLSHLPRVNPPFSLSPGLLVLLLLVVIAFHFILNFKPTKQKPSTKSIQDTS